MSESPNRDRDSEAGLSASPEPPGRRTSQSASAARAAEIARIRRMTPMERMSLALALGRRRRELEALRAVRAGRQ